MDSEEQERGHLLPFAFDPDLKTDVDKLQHWYSEIVQLRHVDIVGDFVGHALFVIHGDSLIRYCLPKSQVDYDGGFQLLHAVHEVEKLLSGLKKRGCNFHIVFFRNHNELCIPAGTPESAKYKYRLTRAILLEHLKFFTGRGGSNDATLVREYESFEDASFQAYLQDYAPQFFMCHDGEGSEEDEGSTLALRHLLYKLAGYGSKIAIINELTMKHSKVFVAVAGGAARRLPALTIAEPGFFTASDAPQRVLESEGVHSDPTRHGSAREILLDDAMRVMKHELKESRSDSDGDAAGLGFDQCVYALIIHRQIIHDCSLSDRPCESTSGLAPATLELGGRFLERLSEVLTSLIPGTGSKLKTATEDDFNLYDILDGRIFFSVLERILSVKIPPVGDSPHILDGESSVMANIRKASPDQAHGGEPASVLPFESPVLGKYFTDIKLRVKNQQTRTSNRIFEELTHWHNAKKVLKGKQEPMEQWRIDRLRRRNQILMSDIAAYSASLTNAAGKVLSPESIIVGSKSAPAPTKAADKAAEKPSSHAKPGKKPPGGAKGKKAMGGREAATSAAKAISDKKKKNDEDVITRGWANSCDLLEAEKNPVQRYFKALKFLLSLTDPQARVVGPDARLYLCNVLLSIWANENASSKSSKGGYAIGMLWDQFLAIAKMPTYSPQVAAAIQAISKGLGLPELTFSGVQTESRALAFAIPALKANPFRALPMPPTHFQLELAGPFLERSFDARPDERVPFEPDKWQRNVLDAIDQNRSLLVVAPTSAGKTFISFYAMKTILQANDDDVIVYVAPTKALVNQIAAEIAARFSKRYPKAGRCVWSVKTRDYVINPPENAQILVTVPHMLQIMLLSPSNAEKASSWSRRVKRIIFDEVHCIGQGEDSIVWEQLLLQAPCPVIALSATVGNPEDFRDWLSSTQAVRGQNLQMVVHSARYSDLRKFIYLPPKEIKFGGLGRVVRLPVPGLDEGEKMNNRFAFIHPVAAIQDRKRGSLEDITLEPRDALELWKQMAKHQTADYPLADRLDPTKFLSSVTTKSEHVAWETELKSILEAWMADPASPFQAVREALRSMRQGQAADTADKNAAASQQAENEAIDYSVSNPVRSLFSLLCDLNSQDALPCLVFDYDRVGCERDLQFILSKLESEEEDWKNRSSEWAEKMKGYAKWEKAKQQKAEAVDPKLSKKEKMRVQSSAEPSVWDSFDPDAPLDNFSFADGKKALPSEVTDLIRRLDDRKVEPYLVSGLRRGLGVHHAGMNRQYRQAVEILFRKGYLRVVVATGTLALGINMPCKTVVFHGDSIFLTALNYRQASGRAGRRGFDLLGNVVFNGYPRERVYEIMESRLPHLVGSFPISTTLVLRLLSLLAETNDGSYAKQVVEPLLSQTRLYLGGAESEMAIKHHLRFSIEYLRQQSLLSVKGTPINFAGLVSHLYHAEEAAFALHSLLKAGYFHAVCANIDSNPKEVLLELVLVLSHLFCRVPVFRNDAKWLREVVHRSSSVVFLPPLPKMAEDMLVKHNRETLSIFKTYVATYATQNLAEEPDDTLPFCNRRIGHEESTTVPASELFDRRPSTKIRSPFSALSGHTDEFETIQELCSTARSNVFLEESAVPYIPMYPRETDQQFNAYIYDFFRNGSLEVLIRDNRIRRGDVWFFLKDFALVIASIVTSLHNYVSSEEMEDEGEEDLMELAEPSVVATDESVFSRPASKAPAAPASVKKKKAVADSWDDGESDEDEDEDEGDSPTSPMVDEALGGSLLKVLKAFKMLNEDFNTKFKKIYA